MYPEIVENKLKEIFPHFEDFIKDTNTDSEILYDILAESMTQKFIKGDELCIWEEDEMKTLLGEAIFLSTTKSLKDKNLVDIVQDEHGEDVMFLTEEGKELASILFGPVSNPEESE